MDKIERMREDVRNLKLDEDAKKAMNLILDIMEDYRQDNQFTQRLINNYFLKGDDYAVPQYRKCDCIQYNPSKY